MTDPRRDDGAGSPAARGTIVPLVLIGVSIAASTLLSWARPNATQPALGPRGPLPGALVPVSFDSATATAVMWGGYAVGAIGLAWLWRSRGGVRLPLAVPLVLAAVALLGAPIGSGDHLNYAAYGRIAAQGGDPYTESPVRWRGGADPVTSAVEKPWTTEPSVYGPVATALQAGASLLGGDSLRATVWWWQVVVVLSWLGVRELLRRILDGSLHERLDLVWTLNPLLWPVAVLGAHVDTLATAFAVAAVWAMHRAGGLRGALAGGVFTGLAGSTKFTYAIVGAGLLVAFGWAGRAGGTGAARTRRMLAVGGGLLVGILLVAVPAHLWSGRHTYDQLIRSRQAVSRATPWRLLLDGAHNSLGEVATRAAISLGAVLLALLVLAAYLRLSRPESGSGRRDPGPAMVALHLTCGLTLAYSFAAPYALPWYDLLVWACLPAVNGFAVWWLAGARLLLMTSAYVPGRVLGMSAEVERVTLGFRSAVAPWVAAGLWAAWLALAVRAGPRGRRARRR